MSLYKSKVLTENDHFSFLGRGLKYHFKNLKSWLKMTTFHFWGCWWGREKFHFENLKYDLKVATFHCGDGGGGAV